MTAASDRYRANAAGFTARVEGTKPDQWEDQSPCEDWTARDVVQHCVDVSGMFFGRVGKDPPTGPSAQDDPSGAWQSARDAVIAALEDPAVAGLEYDGQLGRSTFEQSVDRFVTPDVLIHTWDLARATGQDETLDTSGMEQLLRAWEPLDEKMRSPQGFGPKLEPPPGADLQTRLLCFTGREP